MSKLATEILSMILYYSWDLFACQQKILRCVWVANPNAVWKFFCETPGLL
jgi:hypothetical protein